MSVRTLFQAVCLINPKLASVFNNFVINNLKSGEDVLLLAKFMEIFLRENGFSVPLDALAKMYSQSAAIVINSDEFIKAVKNGTN